MFCHQYTLSREFCPFHGVTLLSFLKKKFRGRGDSAPQSYEGVKMRSLSSKRKRTTAHLCRVAENVYFYPAFADMSRLLPGNVLLVEHFFPSI